MSAKRKKRPKKSKKPVSEELTDLEKEVLARRKLPVLATLMGLRWEPLSEPCPKCGKNALQRGSNMMSGPYGGIVKCDCGHRESAYAFLGRTMIKVEPLPADKEKP